MKKFISTSIMILCMATLFMVSCKKDDPAPPADNTAALLQNKNWKITALTESSSLGVVNIYNDYFDACNRDDLYKFNAGDVFVFDEGPSTCMPGDPQTQSGTWTYNTGNKALTFHLSGTSDTYSLTVVTITEDTFTAKEITVDAGITYTTNWAFAKQ